jgi:iron complex outermembrane receptor protein
LRIPVTPAWVLGLLTGAPSGSTAQQPEGAVAIHVTSQSRPVAGATVASGTTRALTDRNGTAELTLPLGSGVITVSKLGFAAGTLRVNVVAGRSDAAVSIHEAAVELSEIVVSATRDERRIADQPTRVEVTDRDEIEEEIGAAPGVIAELLTESGGVRAQMTSAGLGSTSIRIRGLRGRYTQLLSDGLPLFGLTTEGLGPLQIPPIDLQRIEVIKGVA